MNNFKKYLKIISKYKYITIAAMLVSISTLYGSIVLPQIIGNISNSAKLGTLTNETLCKDIYTLILITVYIYFASAFWNYHIFKNAYYVESKVRVDILKKALLQSPVFLKRNPISEIINKATSDSEKVGDVLGYGLMTIIDGIIYPVFIFYNMSKISIKLTLISMLALPIMTYIVVIISKKYDPTYNEYQKTLDNLNQKALEDFKSIKVIKAFSVNRQKEERFIKSVDENLNKDLKLTRLEALYMPVTEIGIGLFSVIGLIIGATQIKTGVISYGELVTYSLYLAFLTWPCYALADLIIILKEGNNSLKRIEKILDYKDDFNEYKGNININLINSIELKNFGFSYPWNDSFLLKNINLYMEKGKKYGIVGKTGSGKTTLLRSIINEYANFNGEFFINNNDIKSVNNRDFKNNIGYVPQEHFLYSKTVNDNIKFYRESSEEEVLKSIEASDFKKDLKSLPCGIHTLCGEMGVSLSGGQKQRVSLSRAILKPVDLLVLDDILSAVDTATERNILKNLDELMKDKIVVMSSHKISAIKDFDEILVLHEGKIVERGNYDELMANRKWFYEQALTQEVSNEK